VVFPDEPPPEPDISFERLDSLQIKLVWRYEDTKDRQNTQYAITLGTSATNCTDTLVGFSKGTSSYFTKIGEFYSYTFKPADKGYSTTFYFMVIARDERNSISKSGEKGLMVVYPGSPGE
jgi:hypothetical protein